MKTIINHGLVPLGLGISAAIPVLAIEPPQDDTPPPPSVRTAAPGPAAGESPAAPGRQMENAGAYIGLITAEVPEILSAHIGVGPGKGVLVRDLAPDGPAQKAGIEKFDVVTRVAGKSVGSPQQLSEAIAANKPGDEVAIDLIHQGKETTKTVKLETRPDRTQTNNLRNDPDFGNLNLDGLPREQAERLRDLIDRRIQGMRQQQHDLEREFDSPSPRRDRGLKGFQFKSDATFRLMDENGSIEVKSSDGSKEITVRDKANNVTWSGPWDNEQDKAAAPQDIRERIEKFKFDDNFRGGGFRFRFGPGETLFDGE